MYQHKKRTPEGHRAGRPELCGGAGEQGLKIYNFEKKRGGKGPGTAEVLVAEKSDMRAKKKE